MKELTITEHLEELRSSLMGAAGILFLTFFLCYGFGDEISEVLLWPLREALEDNSHGKIVYLGLLDKVLSQLQVAFWTSLIVSSPFWFYFVWRFIKPGLYLKEVRAIRPFVVVGFLLFALGIAFGYFLVFPLTFETLLQFGVEGVDATIGLKSYLTLVCKILIFLGLIFQLPNALLILGFMGLVTKYSLRKNRSIIYVCLAVVSAMCTPPDIVTMLGLWIPLFALFELGVLAVTFIVHPFLEKENS